MTETGRFFGARDIEAIYNYTDMPEGDELTLAQSRTAEFMLGILTAQNLVSSLHLETEVEPIPSLPDYSLATVDDLEDDIDGLNAFNWGYYVAIEKIYRSNEKEGSNS